MNYTIGKLGKLFCLSRSTLLYYDRQGLLCASGRSNSAYRVYSEEDRMRLEKIMSLRAAGIPLKTIRRFMLEPEGGVLPILLNRLLPLNGELETLKKQQAILLEMIESEGSLAGKKPFLAGMRKLGKQAGIHEGNYKWVHRGFEQTSRKVHRRFLRFLGFSKIEIKNFIKQIKKTD